jgi:hypothetical protein
MALLGPDSRVYPCDVLQSSTTRGCSSAAAAAACAEPENVEEDAKQQVAHRCSQHAALQLVAAGAAAARAPHSAGRALAGWRCEPHSLPQMWRIALPILLHMLAAHRLF